MSLVDELDGAIRSTQREVEALEEQLASLKRELARLRQLQGDALRLYRSATGSGHPLDRNVEPARDRPRAEQVLAALGAAEGPVTLAELVAAMPDEPERGAVSAVVHRAIARGEVRRLSRGVYELVDSFARAG